MASQQIARKVFSQSDLRYFDKYFFKKMIDFHEPFEVQSGL